MIIAAFRHCIPNVSDPFSTKLAFLQFPFESLKIAFLNVTVNYCTILFRRTSNLWENINLMFSDFC